MNTTKSATQMAGSIGRVLKLLLCPVPIHHSIPAPLQCNLFRLLVVLISLVVDDVEELELVDASGGGDDSEPVTELLLLEELLGPGYNSQYFDLSCEHLPASSNEVRDWKKGTYRYLR